MPFKNLVLVGMPGSGKTTIGELLAKRLGMPFLDTDLIIEQTAGERICDIFARTGEETFRTLERETVKKVTAMRRIIIATGGGAWMDETNRARLAENGRVVYLNCPPEVLWERLKESRVKRPLLKGGFESLNKLYRSRHCQYMTAHLVLDTAGKSVKQTAGGILEETGLKTDDVGPKTSIYKQKLSFRGDRHCEIVTGSNLLKGLGTFLEEIFKENGALPRLLVVTNPIVYALFGKGIIEGLCREGFNAGVHLIPDGEEYKSLGQTEKVYSRLAAGGFDRGDAVLALGGGVTGDLAGFAAATYMRGMGLVQLPTTLLAQVDSSIGGKTAVNLSEGKNMVGAFYQPGLVVSDTRLLKHLSGYQFRQGLAECVKYGLIEGDELFCMLEQKKAAILARQPEVLAGVVERCCRIKAGIVEKDERETGPRRVLNLGHTVGHALEAAAGYGRLGHGDAVALGIRAKIRIGLVTGVLNKRDCDSITGVLDSYGFPSRVDLPMGKVLEYLGRDKKKRRGQISFIMPKSIGDMDITAGITEELLKEGLKCIGCR
ncbi:MAG: 3-dehydroquinate synthase [Firmicutes bacterium]|nr:3-dehydroquinate synthase [Bacillota bacterium]